MSALKLKLFVALHVLVALAFFGATLWIASHARHDSGVAPHTAVARATAANAAVRPAKQPHAPGPLATNASSVGSPDLPDWLRQTQGRDLERPSWPH